VTVGADVLWHIVVAALGGMAVGVERQWSGQASGASPRFAGLRTFTFMGLVAGVSGWWLTIGFTGPALIILIGIVAVIALSYKAGSRTDADSTTEISAVVVVTAGILAGAGQTTLASGIVSLTVLLLVEKSRLHQFAKHLGATELLAASRFAVMAAVILPLLPVELGPFGPLGFVRPRQLWALVLFFSALSFLGFLARRAFGEQRGYALAGVLGGVASSTAVTLTFSRLSHRPETGDRALAAGVMGANCMLFPRVLLASVVLAPPLAAAVWPAFVAPMLVGLTLFGRGIRDKGGASRATGPSNPLEILSALQMAALFQVVLFGVSLAETWFGSAGLYGSAAVLGLSDVDALTVSLAQRAAAGTPGSVAAAALTVGILANTLVKMTLAFTVGRGRYRVLAGGGLAVMAVTLAAWLAL
jgi:uncharacterized membrane protein (DUF4010 family)